MSHGCRQRPKGGWTSFFYNVSPGQADQEKNNEEGEHNSLRELKADPGNISLESIITEASRLERIRQIDLPADLLKTIPAKLLQRYKDRVMTEPAREIRRHPPQVRYALLAIFLYCRGREITDSVVDLLIQTVHRIGVRAEKKVIGELVNEIKKVRGKNEILYKMASAAWEQPDDAVKDVIFPAVGENTLQNIIREYKYSGSAYNLRVNTRMRLSYRSHYRRMLPRFINILDFYSNNQAHQPIINAAQILRKYSESHLHFYPDEEVVPTDGIVPASWRDLVFETDELGRQKVNRAAYELSVFRVLREKLRCKEIWVAGADRYRNPDEDLPSDFEQKRLSYYEKLGQPLEADIFISKLQSAMAESLEAFDKDLPQNLDVEILKRNKGWIKLTPLESQVEPENLARLKSASSRCIW